MFFLLSKLLLFLLSPLTWVIVGLGLTFFSKSARWKKRGKVTAIFCLLFFSNTFIYKEVCRQWEVFGTPINKVKHYDVGIVLGGMAEYNNDLKTLSSGDNGDLTNKGLHEAKQMKAILVRWGIPKEDIITETVSRNTHQNAVETKKVLDKYYPHYKSFILITS